MPRQPIMTLLVKPASGACNLRCRYCFYADEMKFRNEANRGMMTEETFDTLAGKAVEQAGRSVTFAFQGGEPTLAGLGFFRRLMEIEKKHARPGLEIHNTLQTNGIGLDGEWAEFLQRNHFLVGLSLDGYEELHNENRIFPDGSGTFRKVMETASLLRSHRVDFNILTVVTSRTARSVKRLHSFFGAQGFSWQQYIPCIDPFGAEAGGTPYSLPPERYGRFLKDLFDRWYGDLQNGRPVYNRTFENWVNMLNGCPPESCSMSGVCSKQWVIEADGSVYPCDFYALDEWRLGNIKTDSFDDMEKARLSLGFVGLSEYVPQDCRRCRWYPLCRNGCRRDRVLLPDGQTPGLNRYCAGYRDFFEYAYPKLEEIAGS